MPGILGGGSVPCMVCTMLINAAKEGAGAGASAVTDRVKSYCDLLFS